MLRALLGLLGLLAALQVQAARTTTPLDGAWRFQRADAAGAEAPTFDDSAWTTIALPHTYNAVDDETGTLDTSTVRVLEQNLELIDRAIRDAERALAADPGNAYLNAHLARTMRQKIDLLRQAASLTAARS